MTKSPDSPPDREDFYPAWLDLAGVPVLVVGGGPVARRRTLALMECGAQVTVVAPEFMPEFQAWADQGAIQIERREYNQDDLRNKRLVFACTNQAHANELIVDQAKSQGLLVSSATPGTRADLFPGQAVRKGPLSISISTRGEIPLLARVLRECLDDLFPETWGQETEALSQLRPIPRQDLQALQAMEDRIRNSFNQAVRDYQSKLGAP
jgi:precorrin-2 dehydrogenase/sirohydrochlorin ferrochelatase